MTLHAIAKETWVKVIGGVAAAGITVGVPWLASHVVTKRDLESVVGMVAEEVRAEIKPLAEQTKSNTIAICIGRRATLKAAMRDLKVEIAEMDKLQYEPGWTERDGRLLAEWTADYEDGQEELATLACQ